MSAPTSDDTHTSTTLDPAESGTVHGDESPHRSAGQMSRLLRGLRINRFSGIYIWIGLVVLFGILVPETFLSLQSLKLIANDQAVTAMLAMALVIVIAIGAFDLSIAATMGVSVCCSVWLFQHDVPLLATFLLCLVVGIVIGLVNGVVVVGLNVDSFIAGLAMSSILAAVAFAVTEGKLLVGGLPESYLNIGQSEFFGVPSPVLIMIVVAAVLWFVLEKTPVGRRLYAVGGNREAARLVGLPVDRIAVGALVAGAMLASAVGFVLAAKLGSGSADAGVPYLLPVFSAVFLGSTQVFPGRVNIPGTLVAVFLLATGVKGLQLVGAPLIVTELFNGVVLIVAVALAHRFRTTKR